MMQEVTSLDIVKDITVDTFYPSRNKRQTTPVSDTIYTLDIETTNLFKINGKYRCFDKSIASYKDIEKVACPYIWMFGIEDAVYYGREFMELDNIFRAISDVNITKIIYIHNLSFEFGWLLNIFTRKGYTITDMCSRSVKKPIQFKISELNIIFRCSYMLTNLSLENASNEYTTLAKKVGDLDYNKERSPLTKLTDKELGYCEYDIRCLYAIICHFREEYSHLFKIPLTATGIVRNALRERLSFFYIRKQQKLVPPADIYLKLWVAFSGGYTHANMLRSNKVLTCDVESEDEASAYPSILCTEMFPYKEFMLCHVKQFFDTKKRNSYAFLIKIELKNITSKYYNHYLQFSKVKDSIKGDTMKEKLDHIVLDNGRIVSIDDTGATMWCTDIDYDIIRKNYRGDIKVMEAYKSPKRYLDKEVIKFILELYKNKTTLKGIKDKEAIYKRDKGMLNSIYGMSVTNPLKQSSDFSDYWYHKDFSKEFIEDKLSDMKKSYSTLFFYAVGVWVCAFGRKRIFDILLSSHYMDRDTVYCDTDSVKFVNREKHQDIFLTYNNDMIEKYKTISEVYDDISIKDFMPADKNGVLHPLGFFEFDGLYTEFKTLGAKKYCYREDGKLHLTVSGVSKNGVSALKDDINNFKKGFVWDYDTSGKLTVFYHELTLTNEGVVDNTQKPFEFTDIDGHKYLCDYPYSVVLMPTTYKLGITEEYEQIINNLLWEECTE